MKNLLPLVAIVPALAVSTGCVVYSSDSADPYYTEEVIVVEEVAYNAPPIVFAADAGVYWDDWYFDDVWYFTADVDDPDGVYDVVMVWADVYDEYRGGALVASFELYPTDDPFLWSTEAMGSSSGLDPFYRGYSVDIVAYDSFSDFDSMTLAPYTY